MISVENIFFKGHEVKNFIIKSKCKIKLSQKSKNPELQKTDKTWILSLKITN